MTNCRQKGGRPQKGVFALLYAVQLSAGNITQHICLDADIPIYNLRQKFLTYLTETRD